MDVHSVALKKDREKCTPGVSRKSKHKEKSLSKTKQNKDKETIMTYDLESCPRAQLLGLHYRVNHSKMEETGQREGAPDPVWKTGACS